MNTLIENLNALMIVKKELNKVLVDNEQPGGPVFDTYPEQFRELFRVLEDKIDDVEVGPYATYEPETVVARPVIGFENNVVTLTCATQGAEIHFRTKDVYGNIQGDSNYVGRFSISRDTWIETYAILNGVRSSQPDNSRWCYYQAGGAVPAPEFDRTNGIVTITCRQQGAQIWWRIMPSTTFVPYTGPELVDGTKWLEAYAVYLGKGSETAISEGTEEGITVADPVLTCSDNVVTITCATEDAVIWYKTNLDDEWTVYTEPIEITEDTVFYAYAYKEGNISNTVTESFEYEEPYVPPVVVPADPVISCSNNVVTITCSTSGATIYYSTDNRVTYNEYTGTITISADTTFYAYSELNGETSNTVSYEAQYEDSPQPPQPVAPADPVISCTNNVVTITCSTSGAVIWYSTDGGNTYNIYTEPITISVDTTFYAYSELNGETSNIITYYAEYILSFNDIPLTFRILEDGNVIWKTKEISTGQIIQYKINNGSWTSTGRATLQGITIPVNNGDIIQFKGDNVWYGNLNMSHCSHFDTTCRFIAYGNIMSLYTSSNFNQTTTINSSSTFSGLFYNCTKLISVSNLILSATTFGSNFQEAYFGMFWGCTSLIDTPVICGMTLHRSCYKRMFYGCTSLTTAPVLSSTSLAPYCYSGMFENCTSLINVPILPASIMDEGCYNGMFTGCTSLTTAPVLSSTSLAEECYSGMFSECTSLVNPPSLPATTLANNCYSAMFFRCTSLTSTPSLPANVMAEYCYGSMFFGCTSLTSTASLPATTLAAYCYDGMFASCTSLTSTPSLPATTLAAYCYSGMFAYCSSLRNTPSLSANVMVEGCYYGMFKGCTSLTTAPSLNSINLASYCYKEMFYGCTSLTTAPSLPAITPTQECYVGMFRECTSLNAAANMALTWLTGMCCQYMYYGCSNLNYVKCLAETYNDLDKPVYEWLTNVSVNGTFVKKTNVNFWASGSSGIPSNWTVQEASS